MYAFYLRAHKKNRKRKINGDSTQWPFLILYSMAHKSIVALEEEEKWLPAYNH